MDRHRRRKWGCWTCRLRKLKCDEARDHCQRCRRCQIPCYGYGAKPAWKDGGVREAEKLAAIKAGVAENRRRRALAAKSKRNRNEELLGLLLTTEGHASSLSVGGAISSSSNGEMAGWEPADEDRYLLSMTEVQRTSFNNRPPFSQLLPKLGAESTDAVRALTRRQMQLCLVGRKTKLFHHYLDHVFGLQNFHQKFFRNYPRLQHWFFSLLRSTRPLQHAILSLSALHLQCLHRRGKGQQSISATNDKDTLLEVQVYRTAALQGLRLTIRNYGSASSTDGYTPILACCNQLLSYDIFQGGVDQWYLHLKAATNLVLLRASCSQLIIGEETEPEVKEANIFLLGPLIWCDILACASTGRRPMLYDLLPKLIGPPSESHNPPIRMENIMGCENKVMVLISEISALQEWKLNCLRSRSCSIWNLAARSRAILENLEATILALDSRLHGCGSHSINGLTHSESTTITVIITNIFAHAAIVYLHVVVSGVQPALPEIRESVERTIVAMKHIPEAVRGKVARGILWPLCVAGSVAETYHQPFFRDFVEKAVDDSMGFGNAQTALGILEASWEALNHGEHSNSSICSAQPDADYLAQGWPQIVQRNGEKALLV